MTGVLAKGALVQYLPTWPTTPVVTVFQYNPESMVHTWTQPEPTGKPGVESSNPVAVPGMPGESFQFTIFLDSDDDAVSPVPELQQSAQDSGVGTRLAALEMLLYPLGSVVQGALADTFGLRAVTAAAALLLAAVIVAIRTLRRGFDRELDEVAPRPAPLAMVGAVAPGGA